MSTSWIPERNNKWLPVFKQLVESGEPVVIGLMSVDVAPRGQVRSTPFSDLGFFEIDTHVIARHPETDEVVLQQITKMMFHVDDIGWVTKIPAEFTAPIAERPNAGALTVEEQRALGLIP